jgi:hypothetical protein
VNFNKKINFCILVVSLDFPLVGVPLSAFGSVLSSGRTRRSAHDFVVRGLPPLCFGFPLQGRCHPKRHALVDLRAILILCAGDSHQGRCFLFRFYFFSLLSLFKTCFSCLLAQRRNQPK